MTEYHPVVKKITDLLDQYKLWYETFQHESVRTSEQAALTRPGYTLHQGAKAIIAKVYQSSSRGIFVMLVIPADQKFSSSKVLAQLDAKNIRFATEAEVEQITDGVLPGGVPPFGHLFDLPVYADSSLFANEKIVFNAGDRGFSVGMKSADYATIVKPTVVTII